MIKTLVFSMILGCERVELDSEKKESQAEKNEAHVVKPKKIVPKKEDGRLDILLLGDSITEGVPYTYRYPLYQKLSEAKVEFNFVGSHRKGASVYPKDWDRDNEGHSGWTTSDIDRSLERWLRGYTVDVTLIHLGTNDAYASTMDAAKKSMLSIVKKLRIHNPNVAIHIAQIIPFGSKARVGDARARNMFIRNWNAMLKELAMELTTPASPIVVVDMHTDFGDVDLHDGIHPTKEGAIRMAERWMESLSIAVP